MHLDGNMEIDVNHPLTESLSGVKIVLGSKSPRRVELLKNLGLQFELRPSDAPEDHAAIKDPYQVPLVLAQRKADYLRKSMAVDELLITADTVVAFGDRILEKPKDLSEAKYFLTQLSGNWHKVVTGYTLTTTTRQFCAEVTSSVLFNVLTPREIEYYTSHFEVMDKAGAYGIQDWIGLIGISEINGSYHNVMGLPIAHLYQHLKEFLNQ